jgi:hypothetical protein
VIASSIDGVQSLQPTEEFDFENFSEFVVVALDIVDDENDDDDDDDMDDNQS